MGDAPDGGPLVSVLGEVPKGSFADASTSGEVLERDHHPFAHGPLEYSLTAARFLQAPSGEILSRQAEAYVQSYLRRKKEAPAHQATS